MKAFIFLLLIIVAVGLGYNYFLTNPFDKDNIKIPFLKKETTITIKSSAFSDKGKIPVQYTCDAQSKSPPLSFSGVPLGTRSLLLIVEDLDSSYKNFTHWIVFDINPQVSEIEENSIPESAKEALNDFGRTQYYGPCPPAGTRRYVFKLYALDTMLGFDRGIPKDVILNIIKTRTLEQTELTGVYTTQ